MGLTVGEIASMSHLGITVRAGGAGLHREVEWAHVCELEDPTGWLDGPGLVLTTGMAIPAPAARQRAYVERLARSGMAAVAIASGMSAPPLTRQMLSAADELSFAVLEVAYEVPYLAITSFVVAANRERSERQLLSYLRIFDSLRLAASQGLGPAQLFWRLAEVSGYELHLCSPGGRPLIEGIPGAPAGWESPSSGASAVAADAGLVTVPVPLRGHVAGYLVGAERPGREHLGLLALRHIATIAALELANLMREREAMRREGAETLGEMLSGILDLDAVKARLRLAGLDAGSPLVLAAVANDRGEDRDLHSRLLDLGVPHLILQRQHELFVLLHLPAGDPGFLAATPGSHVGLSRPFRARKSLELPRREALWALRYARSQRRALIEHTAMRSSATWLPADPQALAGIVAEILGPLAAYDAEHGTELQRTLLVLLDRDRNVAATARALGVHRNTVIARISRVEELTGRDLRRVQDLAELWLAAGASDLLGDQAGLAESRAVLPDYLGGILVGAQPEVARRPQPS
jgi:PucR family transcriptional regulator, purine catabolism regulatory protein